MCSHVWINPLECACLLDFPLKCTCNSKKVEILSVSISISGALVFVLIVTQHPHLYGVTYWSACETVSMRKMSLTEILMLHALLIMVPQGPRHPLPDPNKVIYYLDFPRHHDNYFPHYFLPTYDLVHCQQRLLVFLVGSD
jgi:hypothetical protein